MKFEELFDNYFSDEQSNLPVRKSRLRQSDQKYLTIVKNEANGTAYFHKFSNTIKQLKNSRHFECRWI